MSNIRNDFYIAVGGEIVAQIEFVIHKDEKSEGNRFVIFHTLVADRCRGQGLGKALIDRVVKHARIENKSVQSVCPFAKMILEKEKQYHDVLI